MIKQIVSLIFTTAFSIKAIHLWILFFRISISTFMLTHGLPKLSKLMSGDYEFADPLGIGMITSLVLASFSEAICSIFILFGAFTKIATIPPIITMAVAAFIVHQFDPFSKKELSLLYLLTFLTIFIVGSGKYSFDELIQKKITKKQKEFN